MANHLGICVLETSTPLAGAASYTGPTRDLGIGANGEVFLKDISVLAYASHAGTLYVEFSTDGTNWTLANTTAITAWGSASLTFPIYARYFRVRYTNGATLQTYFRIHTVVRNC